MNVSLGGPQLPRAASGRVMLNPPSAVALSPRLPNTATGDIPLSALSQLATALSQLPSTLPSPESIHAARWR